MIRLFRWLLRERAVCLMILAAGVVATAIVTFAIAPSHASDPGSFLSPKDGPIYRGMAASAVAGDEFRDPNGERSHKMSPVFPLFISAFMLVLGTDETTVRIAAFASYLLAIAALHRTTSDLFGRRAGLLFAAGYAACPLVSKLTATYTSDNLIVAMFALTLWAVLRATREPRMMILAGIFAGCLALLRAGFLPILVVGAVCGLGWRLQHRGWRAFRDPFYLSGGALFVSMNVAWAARNLMHFGDLRGDPYYYASLDALLTAPTHLSITALALEAVIVIAVFMFLGSLFRHELALSLRSLPSLFAGRKTGPPARKILSLREWTSGLWLAFLLSAGFLVLSAAAFLNLEILSYGPAKAATGGQMLHYVVFNGYWRYYLPTAVPLVWLGLMFAPRRLTGGGRAPMFSRTGIGREPSQGRAEPERGPRRSPEAV